MRRTPSTSSTRPADHAAALTRLLHKCVVVDDLAAARALVAEAPDLTAVTRDGDVLGAHFASGGSATQPSLIEIQAAVDDATSQLAEATATAERLGFDISRLEAERHAAQQRVDVALAKLHESDATLAAVAEELGQYGSQARVGPRRGRAARHARSVRAEEARDTDLAGLADLEERLARAEEAPDEEPDTTARERLAEAAREARQGEMDARLALRTSEERARALHGRADQLVRAAQAEREARARAAERRERLLREGRAAEAVGIAVGVVLQRLEVSVHRAAEARSAVEAGRAEREQQLLTVRSALRDLAREHDELVSSVHRDEMARTQQRMRIEQLEERALEELGLDGDAPARRLRPRPARCPSRPTEPTATPTAASRGGRRTAPEPIPYVREEQQKRLRTAERALAMLGRVNPLALEEFAAMEERHKFLTEQLEDLKKTRKDLLDIVREVDARVEEVFTEAYADVAKAFDATFSRLFPGGEGRLVLTEPGDMLATGVEVEARPPGKKVKRLSLLSGGERSLVAVAFLVALFKARPSPFYILDEVEAALDDTNLGRLLEIYEELRENSPAARDHPPEADHGGRRRPLRRHHARRRRLHRDQPAAARGRVRPEAACTVRRRRPDPPATDYVYWEQRHHPLGRHRRLRAHEQRPLLRAHRHGRQQPPRATATGVDIRELPAIGVVAEVGCRYFAEVGYPEPVDLGVVVDRVGRSSVVYRVGLFQGEATRRPPRGGSCTCTSTTPTPPARSCRSPTQIRAAVDHAAEVTAARGHPVGGDVRCRAGCATVGCRHSLGEGTPPVLSIVISMVVIVVLAGLVVTFVAFPHRGEEVPGASWLGDSMNRAVDVLPTLDNTADDDEVLSEAERRGAGGA